MNPTNQIFRELFRQEPLSITIPNWSRYSTIEFIHANGLEAPGTLQLDISKRADSELHFYNDAYQSHISALITSDPNPPNWCQPMESLIKQLFRQGRPISGYNLYFSGMAEKKKGKTYELLLKTSTAMAISELNALQLERDELIRLICSSNENSVLDALFLSQIIPQIKVGSAKNALEKV